MGDICSQGSVSELVLTTRALDPSYFEAGSRRSGRGQRRLVMVNPSTEPMSPTHRLGLLGLASAVALLALLIGHGQASSQSDAA